MTCRGDAAGHAQTGGGGANAQRDSSAGGSSTGGASSGGAPIAGRDAANDAVSDARASEADVGPRDASTDGTEGGRDEDAGSDVVPAPTGEVLPLYPTNGAYWNDYVKADGTGPFDATGSPCDANDGPTYEACIHAGELRAYDVTGVSSCAGLVAVDDLDAFVWKCVERNGLATMVSTALAGTARLSTLIDASSIRFRENGVTVKRGGSIVARSNPTVWWTNRIVAPAAGTPAGTGQVHDIVLVTRDAGVEYVLDADKMAFVTAPGSRLAGGATPLTARANFLWIEGAIDASASDVSIDGGAFLVVRNLVLEDAGKATPGDASVIRGALALSRVKTSRITDVSFPRSTMGHVNINDGKGLLVARVSIEGGWTFSGGSCTGSRFEDITLTDSQFSSFRGSDNQYRRINVSGSSIYLHTETNSSFEDLTSTGSGGDGIAVVLNKGCTFRRLRAAKTGSSGIRVASAPGNHGDRTNIFDDVVLVENELVSGSAFPALHLMSSDRTTFNNVRIYGNRDAILDSGIQGSHFSNVFVSGGTIVVSPAQTTTLQNVTVVNSPGDGVKGFSRTFNVSNLLVANSGTGFHQWAAPLGDSPTVRNLALVGSDTGIALESGAVTLSGALRIGGNTPGQDCSCPSCSGAASECLKSGSSPGTMVIVAAGVLEGVFAGSVTADAANPSDTNGSSTGGVPLDVFHFDTSSRLWALGGSAGRNPNLRGWCTDQDTCRIVELGLREFDVVARNIATKLPTGDDVLEARDPGGTQGYCNEYFPGSSFVSGVGCVGHSLKDAVELLFDGAGDDDGLCESNETCLFSPNAGAYQGHGDLVSAGTFVPGRLTGITLLRYAENGY
jgi:hypothetical protein